MATLASSLAYAVTGGVISMVPQGAPPALDNDIEVWALPSAAVDRVPRLIALSTAIYEPGPAIEAAMRGAVLASTEHCYDL